MSYVLWKVVFTQTASARRPPKLLTCITSLSPFSTKFDRLRELISLEAGSQNLQLSLMTITVHCNTCGRWFILLSNWGRCAFVATFWRQWRLSQKLGARFPMGNCHSYLYMCVLTQRGRGVQCGRILLRRVVSGGVKEELRVSCVLCRAFAKHT